MLKYLTFIFFQAEIKEAFRQPVQPQLETFVQVRRESSREGWFESRPDRHNLDLLYYLLVSSYVVGWQPLISIEVYS